MTFASPRMEILPVKRTTSPGKRACGNARIVNVARGPVLESPATRPVARGVKNETYVRYTIAANGAIVNGYVAKSDNCHGDITGKPGFANT